MNANLATLLMFNFIEMQIVTMKSKQMTYVVITKLH